MPELLTDIDADAEAHRGIDAFVNDEIFDWSAQSVYFQEAYKDEWFTQTRPPNYGDYVDYYFDEHLTQLHWNYQDQQKLQFQPTFGEGIAAALLVMLWGVLGALSYTGVQ